MPNPYAKATAGQPLSIPAAVYNELLDCIAYVRGEKNSRRGGSSREARGPGFLAIKNTTGGDLSRFAIVAFGAPTVTPSTDAATFQNDFVVAGTTPTLPDDLGRFAILTAPIVAGEYGKAIVAGVTPVKLEIVKASHQWADVKASSSELKSAQFGAAQIIWKESGTGTGKWALVRIGPDDTGVIYAKAASGIPARSGSTCGSATVRLWSMSTAGVLSDSGVDETAYNFTGSAVTADKFIALEREARTGLLMVTAEDCS